MDVEILGEVEASDALAACAGVVMLDKFEGSGLTSVAWRLQER